MKHRFFVSLIVLEALVLVSLVMAGSFSASELKSVHRDNRELVQIFGLTDLAIWTEARYTRHLSQADVFSPFQDTPGALEHFPSGALSPLPMLFQPSPSTEVETCSEADDEPTS